MSTEIIVAIITLIGTLAAAGIAAWATLKNRNQKSEDSPSTQGSIFDGLTPASRDDVSWRIGEELSRLPKEICPEGELFFIAEQMFRRPAFYNHPERHWIGGLYAFIVTRLVWEQEVMRRISASKLGRADQVLSALLEIESFVAITVGLTLDELTTLTQDYIKDKEKFIDNWHIHPKISIETFKKRSELLMQLQSAMQDLGFNISGIGQDTVSDGLE